MVYDSEFEHLELKSRPMGRLVRAAVAFGGLVAGALLVLGGGGFLASVLGSALIVASGVGFAICLWVLIRNRPVLVADAKGFALNGRPSQPWHLFQGVQIRHLHPRLFPSARWIAIRVGDSRRSAQLRHVFPSRRSGSAEEIAAAITEFAAEMKRRPAAAPPIQFRSADEDVRTVTPFHKVIEERAAKTAAE